MQGSTRRCPDRGGSRQSDAVDSPSCVGSYTCGRDFGATALLWLWYAMSAVLLVAFALRMLWRFARRGVRRWRVPDPLGSSWAWSQAFARVAVARLTASNEGLSLALAMFISWTAGLSFL
jgi:hypothetical protein